MSIPLPYAHQVASLKRLAGCPRIFDTSDPGTGKTRVEIDDFVPARQRGERAALILAPRSLLEVAWQDDFERFAPGVKVSVAHAKNREEAFKKSADVYVTNIDAVRWLAKQPRSFFNKFGRLIVDESSAYKHHTSERSKALNKIKSCFEIRRLMTGTPNSNTILDLWNQLYILDDGQRLGKSFYAFRNAVCTAEQVGPMPNMLKWTDKPGAEIVVAGLIQDITIRHVFKDCIDIPQNHEHTISFRLPSGLRRIYAQMEKHALALVSSGVEIDAVNAAAQVTKLLQIASGASYTQNGQHALLDTSRYELIADLIEERKHSVVFFNWRHQRDELMKELTKRAITFTCLDGEVSNDERTRRVRDFQVGFYRVMLAQPQSAAHGLTLTKATTTIWASPTYNLEHKLQGDRRIYRAGQTERTETINVIAAATIEEHVQAKLTMKNARQSDLLSMLVDKATEEDFEST